MCDVWVGSVTQIFLILRFKNYFIEYYVFRKKGLFQ